MTEFRRDVDPGDAVAANQRWWDAESDAYQDEHGEFLGPVDFVWCPEGLREADAHLLGSISGKRVIEVGCGAAQCARWLAANGADVFAFDLSATQLLYARRLAVQTGIGVPLVQADARRLPFRDESVDIACSAFGALPFLVDTERAHREVARVLRPGGRWVFSVEHPVQWCFRGDPGREGLVVRNSYFDRRPYVESDDSGVPTYVNSFRTIGDHVRELVAVGLSVLDIVEPEWPEGHDRVWASWNPLRGRLMPGTAIFVAEKRQ